MRRRSGAGGGAVLGGDHVGDAFGGVLAQAYLDERADHDSHHVPEEAGAFDADEQSWGAVAYLAGEDGAHGGVAAVAGAGEAGEIVSDEEVGGGLAHGGDVEGVPAVPGEVGEEEGTVFVVPNEVLVVL